MERSLSSCLHDADLIRIEGDREARAIRLELVITHLQEFAKLPADVRWILCLHDVTHALAETWQLWPGPRPETRGLTREQESAAVAEYQAKGRISSVDWDGFEQQVKSERLWLKGSELMETDGGIVLSGNGHLFDSDRFFAFKITARRLSCCRTDGTALELEALIDLGDRYWEDFGQREDSALPDANEE